MAETATEAQKRPKSFSEINIYSKKFLLTLAFCIFVGYGMYSGAMPWKDGANYMAWVIAFYLCAEGYADGKGNEIGQMLKTVVGAGLLTAPVISAPSAPPEPKPADGGEAPPA